MRVLIVTSIFPPEVGGPATYVPMLAAGLHERGHMVKILTLSEPRQMQHQDKYTFEVVRVSRAGPRSRRALRLLKEAARLAGNADVVYGNSTSMLEPALVARARRKPYVLKVVGDAAWEVATRRRWTDLPFQEFQRQRLSPRLEALKRLRTWHAKRARFVITPSRFLADVVGEWGVDAERIEVVSNAVAPVNGIVPAPLPIDAGLKLVSVGRLVSWKHVDGVIGALSSVVGEPGLVVVGDGPERPRLEALVRELGLGDRVYFAGSRGRDETMALMMACDVFVLNSSYEGLPHTVAEAMTLGLAIVTTGAGGTTEAVQDGQTALVASSERADLAETLRRLLADQDLRASLGERAKEVAREKFGPEPMIAATEDILAACV